MRRLLQLALFALFLSALPSQAFALPPYFNGSEADFYQLPATIPAGAPGTVVRWQRFAVSPVLTGFADPVLAYRMLYISTGARGERTLVSGSLIMPVRLSFNSGSRPIIGFATGTQGMADRCAAVHGVKNTTNYDLVYMRPALDKGWALAIADYQGLGPKTEQFQGGRPDEHTEAVGQTNGRNVLDAVRAAPQFANQFDSDRQANWPEKILIWANMSSQSKVVYWGYSEGGSAAAWAGELAPTYAPELRTVGVAAGGVPADILKVGQAINTIGSKQNFSFGVLAATAIGFKAAYPELKLEENLNAAGLKLISDVKKECLFEFIAKNFAGKTLDQYVNPNPGGVKWSAFTDPAWLARFEQNKLGKTPPKVPVYMWHANSDEALEYCQARQLAKTYCAKGVHVVWQRADLEHATGWVQGLTPSLNFVQNRIDGTAPASSCAALQGADQYCPGQ